MKVIVTGGAGFIGSHIVDKLLELKYEVVVIDNLSTGLKSNLDLSKVRLYDNDIGEEFHFIEQIFNREEPDIVYHLAAKPGVPMSVKFPIETHNTNVNGTLNVLEASRNSGVRRVVFSSSSSVYGGTFVQPTPETQPLNPKSPYAAHKMICEKYCKLYSEIYGLDTVCLRYFNVFGSRQRHDSPYAAVIPAFINCAKTGKTPVIYGDGEQCRDFCYITNVVAANLFAGNYHKPFDGLAFNVGCGEKITINKVHELSGAPKAKHMEERAGDVRRSQADMWRLKTLGFIPSVSFEEGMRKLMNEDNN